MQIDPNSLQTPVAILATCLSLVLPALVFLFRLNQAQAQSRIEALEKELLARNEQLESCRQENKRLYGLLIAARGLPPGEST